MTMNDDYSIEALINAIKSQQVIWNTKLRDYNNKEKKTKAWNIVCMQVIDNFNEKNEMLKSVIGQILKKEWKILKYAYFKFCEIKPAIASAHKYYVYRQQLSFLKTIKHSIPGRSHTSDGAENFTNISQENKRKSSTSDEEDKTQSLPKRLQTELPNCAEDQDRMFLLSLVKDFTKIDDQFKLDARSDIINVIKYYRGLPHPSNGTECKYMNNNSNSSYLSNRSPERRYQSSVETILVDDPLPTHFNGSFRCSSMKRE